MLLDGGPSYELFLDTIDFEGMEYQENDQFSFIDSAVLYGIIKARQPRMMIEVGCGNSTRIIQQVLEGELICIDPDPRLEVQWATLVRSRVQDVPLETFAGCDCLFIDSSHIVTQGGDLPFLYFEVFPRLAHGTLIHSHDIFLPDDYPEGWLERCYTEQYFLAALLEGNDEYDILWPAYYEALHRPEKLVEKFGVAGPCGSLWMVK